jgi:hypothetical protein
MDANSALRAADSDYQALINQKAAETKPVVDKASSALEAPRPAIPEMQKVGAAPGIQDFRGDAAGWANAMAAFSVIAGGLSKHHGTTALKAFGAGMKGFNEGSQQAFDDAYKTWEGNTKAALDNNKMVLEKYNAVLNDRALTVQEAEQKIKLIAFEHQDQMMIDADRFDLMAALVTAKVKAETNLSDYDTKLKMQKKIWDEKNNEKKADKLEPSIDQDTADFAADQLLAGDKSGLSNYGRGEKATANLALIHSTVQKRAADKVISGGDLAKINAQFAGQVSEARAIGTASGKIELAANSLDESLPLLEDAMKGVDLSQFPDINSVENYARQHAGEPNIVKLNTALQTTVSDYSTLIARNGQRTDATDAAAKHLANVSMSNGQLQAFIDQVKKERNAQLRATKKTKEGGAEPEGDAPSGVDPDLWGHMTPEEKALWQTPSP